MPTGAKDLVVWNRYSRDCQNLSNLFQKGTILGLRSCRSPPVEAVAAAEDVQQGRKEVTRAQVV